MKTRLPLAAAAPAPLLALLLSAGTLGAAPLTGTTAVHTRPDPASPAVTFLKAGTEPVPAAGARAETPAGWMAVDLPGPFEAYVENKDLTKSLDLRPGAPIRLAPRADAGILVLAEKDDKTTITGLRGRWTQISLEKTLTGYINVGGAAGHVPPIATATAGSPPLAAAPVTPGAHGPAAGGRASPMVDLGDGGSASLPRQFAGLFVSTRRPLTPRRPYDYALNDEAGRRYAYLDTSKLLLTDQLEKYVDHAVVVFGTARTTAGGKDFVIEIESLQLK
jgi:hypothetical protein